MKIYKNGNQNLTCNMCDGNMKHILYRTTHIWSCKECMNVQFEYFEEKDIVNLEAYLKGDNFNYSYAISIMNHARDLLYSCGEENNEITEYLEDLINDLEKGLWKNELEIEDIQREIDEDY